MARRYLRLLSCSPVCHEKNNDRAGRGKQALRWTREGPASEGGTGLPHSKTLARLSGPHPFSKALIVRTWVRIRRHRRDACVTGRLCENLRNLRTFFFLAVFALCGCCAANAGQAAEHRPFPQHTVYTRGTLKPSSGNQAALDRCVLDFYAKWRQKYLRTADPGQLYVFANAEKGFDLPATRTVSEAHGYGMVAAVLLAGPDNPTARADFDALVRFFLAHPAVDHPALMAWRQVIQPKTGKLIEDGEGRMTATDGDLDIAYALLLADRQWGSAGAIDYRGTARKVMAAILAGESDSRRHILTLGDWVDDESRCYGSLRSSDFVPDHFKAFAATSGDVRWTQIADTTYDILQRIGSRFSPDTGLLPDFVVPCKNEYAPAPPKFLEGSHDGQYFYNACRDPWRLGTDYLLSGDPRALALLRPMNAWIQKATEGDPDRIGAGYTLRGHCICRDDDSAAFLAPFAVAAMADPAAQEWLDALWDDLADRHLQRQHYYENTIELLTLVVLSGNWWAP